MKRKLLLLLLYAGSAFPQAGMVDTSFGTNGKTVTGFGSNSNWANAIAAQPDGKLVVAGTYISPHGDNDFALARYNADGSPDTSFGVEGKAVTDFVANGKNYSYILSVQVQPDGKILAMGAAGILGFPPQMGIVRYNADGGIDTSFGTNGIIISYLSPFDIFGNKLQLLPDGKFMVTGAKFLPMDDNYYVGIERYTAEGVLDTTFGTNGEVVASWGSGKSQSSSMLLKADGKFAITGTYIQTNNPKMALMQFNANGTPDTGFDGDGKVVSNFGSGTYAQGVQLFEGDNGKIIVAGIVYNSVAKNFGLAQYNANGSPDTAFDTDGYFLSPFAQEDDYASITNVVRQADGKYIAICGLSNIMLNTSDFVLRRYEAGGPADMAFGTNGKATVSFDTGLNEALAAIVTPGGEIVIAGRSAALIPEGSVYGDQNQKFAVTRISASGTLDTTFGTDGKVTAAFEKGNDEVAMLLVLPDDKILAIGTSGYRQSNNTLKNDIALAKYNSNGSLDTTFGNLGKIYASFDGHYNTITAAALQPDGKFLVCNMYGFVGQTDFFYEIFRYNANGTPDVSFGTDGKISPDFAVTGIVLQADGKIVVAGNGFLEAGNYGYFVSRYTPDGTLDSSFDTDGKVFVPIGIVTYQGVCVLLQGDGKIVLCGSAIYEDFGAPKLAVTRVNANGGIDTSYGTNGTAWVAVGDAFFFQKAFLQPDGKIIAAGLSIGGSKNFASARLTADGTADGIYGADGAGGSILTGYDQIHSVALQPDGKLLVALGKYNQPADSYDFIVKRFNPDGSIDTGFSDSDGLATSFYNGYDEAFAVALQSDYKIVVAGSTFNGISKDFALVRYGTDLVGVTDPGDVQQGIAVYPNPAKDTLHIEAAEGFTVSGCTLYNMQGQAVYSSNGGATQIDTAALSSGMYIIKATTNKGVVSTKFMKE